jgi:hypothetical protein
METGMAEQEKVKKVTVARHLRVSLAVEKKVQDLADQYEIEWGAMCRIVVMQGLNMPLPPPWGHGEEE